MKKFKEFSYLEELSYQELINIEGGVDKESTAYKIGHSIGVFVGACEASLLKIANSIFF